MRKLCTLGSILGFLFCVQFLSAQSFSEVAKLVNSDRDSSDFFGAHIAMDGNFAIVGANFADEDANGNNYLDNAGAAYIFQYNPDDESWSEVQKLVASDRTAGDEFGYRVAISSDLAVVSTFRQQTDENGENPIDQAGAAYVFERQPGGSWIEKQKLVAFDRDAADRFGRGLAISGQYIMVGASDENEDANGENSIQNAGSVYVYRVDLAGNWSEWQKLVASDRANGDLFGFAVAMDDDYAVVGAYGKDEDVNGTTENTVGAAYFFQRDELGNWSETQKFNADNMGSLFFYGHSVAMQGAFAIVGASQEDVEDSEGNLVNQSGAAYVYHRNESDVWTLEERLVTADPDPSDYFGISVDIHPPYAIIGAYQDDDDGTEQSDLDRAGSAYIFQGDGNGNWAQLQKLTPSDRAEVDFAGRGVAIDGSKAMLGAPGQDSDSNGEQFQLQAGAVYVYKLIPTATTRNTLPSEPVLYPNPSPGDLRIDLQQLYPQITARLLTIDGKQLYRQSYEQIRQLELPVDGPAGVYLLELRTVNGEQGQWKVVKQ